MTYLNQFHKRIDGTYDEENRRIKEISDELQKLCRLHEAQLRDGKENVNCYEIEQRAAESYAKSVGMWIPMSKYPLGEVSGALKIVL